MTFKPSFSKERDDLRVTWGPGEADFRVTTGIVKDVGAALEDKDVDRGDDGLVVVGEFDTFGVDATCESIESGNGTEELVDVVSLLEEATGGSS